LSARHSVYAGLVQKAAAARSTGLRPSTSINEDAVTNRGARNHYKIVMFGKKKFFGRNCSGEQRRFSAAVSLQSFNNNNLLITTFPFAYILRP